jgi:hypothetical protein
MINEKKEFGKLNFDEFDQNKSKKNVLFDNSQFISRYNNNSSSKQEQHLSSIRKRFGKDERYLN